MTLCTRSLTLNRSGPEVGYCFRSVSIRRVEFREFLCDFTSDPVPPFADLRSQAPAVFGDVFENDPIEQHGYGIQIAGEGIGALAQGFEWNGAAAGKRVDDERPGAGRAAQRLVSGLGERPA